MFNASFFDGSSFTLGPLGPSSAFFDGCYFDPDYFDATECVVSNDSGRGPRGRPLRIPQLALDEGDELFALI